MRGERRPPDWKIQGGENKGASNGRPLAALDGQSAWRGEGERGAGVVKHGGRSSKDSTSVKKKE